MISENDRRTIEEYARLFGVDEVYIFGSSATDGGNEPHDIDVAVRGLAPSEFFAFYAKLIERLSKTVDLVDLSVPNRFTRAILQSAVKIYGRPERAA